MTKSEKITILSIVNNEDKFYDGDLRHYFGKVLLSSNRHAPYHNVYHTCTVAMNIYKACLYYGFEPRVIRNLLIAGLYHDMGHRGSIGEDDSNINCAIGHLHNDILEIDQPFLWEIENLIEVTRFPYQKIYLRLHEQIMRDADMAQLFEPEWIQQVMLGLVVEYKTEMRTFFRQQMKFVTEIHWYTDWAKENIEPLVPEKLNDITILVQILEEIK